MSSEITTKPLPADTHERHRILTDRQSNLFVEAGAGTGKTRALVDRVEALVLDDGVAMESIAMITFTEKAALELRDRIQQRFERSDNPRARTALQQVDGAAVGTLHSFAQRILAEHPVEAGLPPGIEILDEIGSEIEFEQQWQTFCDELLEDQTAAKPLLMLEALGVHLSHLRSVATQMADNWDLIEQNLDFDPVPLKPINTTKVLEQFDRVVAFKKECVYHGDRLFGHLKAVTTNRKTLSEAFDEIEFLSLLNSMGATKPKPNLAVKPGRAGEKHNWKIDPQDVRYAINALGVTCDKVVSELGGSALEHIGVRIGKFVLAAAEQRREAGRLQFHDLLVRARRLLRDETVGEEVRASLHRQFTHLLLDEFQDTDPIQIELAVLITTSDRHIGNRDWWELAIEPGRLFFVGDPKQSIYRFRRADIGLYLQAREHFTNRASLTVNFRTVSPVIKFINDVFSHLIEEEKGSQPKYEPLSAFRGGFCQSSPAVALLGAKAIEAKISADGLRQKESTDVAATLQEVLSHNSSWQVQDPEGGWRKARPSDVCILLPTRTSLASLQSALDDAAIPYRAETSSLVYNSREVRELMMALRAVSDPTDELALVSALRSFVYGCGDDDLANWRHDCNGRFHILSELPAGCEKHRVGMALTHLKRLHEQHHFCTPAKLLDQLIRERGVLESAVANNAPRDVWRRFRFVVDQSRAWTSSGNIGLRAYLEWVRRQGDEHAKVTENVLPETDDESVQIMTVHGSKGLEFPITVLAGMSSRLNRHERGPAVHYPPNESVVLKVSKRVATKNYQTWQATNAAMDEHESLRLLYVAATRARDHLIVCLHRTSRTRSHTKASVLAKSALRSNYATPYRPKRSEVAEIKRAPRQPLIERKTWQTQLDTSIKRASRPRVMSATELARTLANDPGMEKDATDLDLPPWQKGRYGTAIGRAVHAVLQEIDLASNSGIEEAVTVQVEVEQVRAQRSDVERMVYSALSTTVVQEAVRSMYWREVWVGASLCDRIVEGYIDLLYRHGSNLVVVDWKTDYISNEAELQEKLASYRLQGASYVAAVEKATGLQVARMVFVFLGNETPLECELDDLAGAVANVKELLLNN